MDRFTQSVDAVKVNLRKHRSAVWRSAVPNLGVTCHPFYRCEAPPFLQFAILSCQRVPQTPHFGGLPAPAKQTLNRLPIVMTKCEGDPVVPRAKLDADLFLFVEPRGGEEIATLPEDQCVAQFQPFQYRPKLRDPRVGNFGDSEKPDAVSRNQGRNVFARKLRLRSSNIKLFSQSFRTTFK